MGKIPAVLSPGGADQGLPSTCPRPGHSPEGAEAAELWLTASYPGRGRTPHHVNGEGGPRPRDRRTVQALAGAPIAPQGGGGAGSPPAWLLTGTKTQRGKKARARGQVMSSSPTGDMSPGSVTKEPEEQRRRSGSVGLYSWAPPLGIGSHSLAGRTTSGPRLWILPTATLPALTGHRAHWAPNPPPKKDKEAVANSPKLRVCH